MGEGRTLFWSGGTRRRGAVVLVLNSFARKALLTFKLISSCLLRVRVEGKHGKMPVLTCYALTNEAKDEDKDDSYAFLSSELSSVPPHNYLIVLEDFNAGIANSSGLYDAANGPMAVDILNDNGKPLLNCCITHALLVTDTWFLRRDIAMQTWYSNDGKTKEMLDYIIIR
ncbi:hypothetical protein QYM36_010280 [Artemia franciscana]|uniref:Endonuclease/exonuclease/phosphatase domain-containing protein n=1 Tax=Artemia franciscana TaxID=6661 RepID=A0AA88I066_ARTSF|nr:hypothetical protein QYM36_010280 [Artemia franciscana]